MRFELTETDMRGLALAACLLAGGCGGTTVLQPPSPGESQSALLQRIERGATTKDQVRSLFAGRPEIELVNNGEQWTYLASSKVVGGNLIPGVGSTPETEIRTLIVIVFDNRGIIADFTSYTESH